jgi:pyruvate,orthophosphate dikinase
MEEQLPQVYGELARVFDLLETHYRDMQDIEFTVERGQLFMLQTRSGKRTAKAALRIAVDMAREGLISEEEAVLRVDPSALDQLLHPTLDPDAPRKVIAKGPARLAGRGLRRRRVRCRYRRALCRPWRKGHPGPHRDVPEDIHGMHAAQGILTARGGMTSHAAVVARGMGRPCVSGAGQLQIDYKARRMKVGGVEVREDEVITIDGSTGEVMLGHVPTVQPELVGDFGTLMVWADRVRRLRVRTNAETPNDCRTAREFGAEGIGLCRTEHMFFDSARIAAVREMILADTEKGRRAALAKLLPEQRGDFAEIFRIMAGLPVTIRLLDPPLHEFLPHTEEEFAEVAAGPGVDFDTLKRRAGELHEFNPDARPSRLPARHHLSRNLRDAGPRHLRGRGRGREGCGRAPIPEVMVPLVGTRAELAIIKALIDRTRRAVFAEQGSSVEYLVGTMIELPAPACWPGRSRRKRKFFSFGTNDLTQTALGVSRDDAGHFPHHLCRKGHLRPRSVRQPGRGWRRRAHPHRGRAGPGGAFGDQARHLRRTWRRSRLDRLLRGGRPRLRQCFALPSPNSPPRRGSGCAAVPVTGSTTCPRSRTGCRDAADEALSASHSASCLRRR